MKSVKYVIEQELHHNGQWYGCCSQPKLSLAMKEYRRYRKNVKGDRIMAEMQARMRIRKVIEEVIIEQNAF